MIWSPDAYSLDRAKKLRIKDNLEVEGIAYYYWNRYKERIVYHNEYSYLIVNQGNYEPLGLVPLLYDPYQRSWRLYKDSIKRMAELLGIAFVIEFKGNDYSFCNVSADENLLLYSSGNRLINLDCKGGDRNRP